MQNIVKLLHTEICNYTSDAIYGCICDICSYIMCVTQPQF